MKPDNRRAATPDRLRAPDSSHGIGQFHTVFSNTKMSLKVGGRRSRSRSWEVSEWKGDVEVHEGPVQALIGLESEG